MNKRLERVVEELPSTYSIVEPARQLVSNGHRVLLPAAETAYLSMLAYYTARADFLALTTEQVLDLANCFAKQAGLLETPKISETLANDLKIDNLFPGQRQQEE